jgi:hypothetical protein
MPTYHPGVAALPRGLSARYRSPAKGAIREARALTELKTCGAWTYDLALGQETIRRPRG